MNANEIRVVELLNNSNLKFNAISQVYQTTDYSLFKNYRTQREPDHVGRIQGNILEKGYVTNPILVTIDPTDGKLLVIDGNNRRCALQELGLPISFIILKDATEDDMITLNLVSKNWGGIDYVRFYATKGVWDYQVFLAFIDEYSDFSFTTIRYALQLSTTEDRRCASDGVYNHKLEKGLFKVVDTVKSREILDFCMKVKEIELPLPIFNQQNFVLCVMRLFRLDGFDPETLLYKMQTNKIRLGRCDCVKHYAEMLEDIYNIRRRGGTFHFDI